MGMFVDYATVNDLAEYMGKAPEELPTGASILIKRASELVGISIRNNYDSNNENHVEAVKLATCSQCQNWIETEISPVSNGNISSYSLGELSVTLADVDKFGNKLCTSAVRYLNNAHLTYKGLGV